MIGVNMRSTDFSQRTRALTMVALLVCAFAAVPTATAQGPGWTVKSTVIRLVNTSNGGVNVRLSPDLTNCVSQSGYGSNYASIYPNHEGINRIKADLLYAFATGTQVSIYLSDANCTVSEMTLESY
jgi:hypothetical protein